MVVKAAILNDAETCSEFRIKWGEGAQAFFGCSVLNSLEVHVARKYASIVGAATHSSRGRVVKGG